MTPTGIISAIIVGVVIGALGRLFAPGRQNISILVTIIVGVVAAFLGTAIVGPLRDTNGIDWVELLVQIALAVVGVVVASRLLGSRRA
ncbi:GlsB/YeaQ/YmgE family stress response membrane protein [Actinotalea sp.]|uniref:GlsB/YeaQ/YmgE family stress response membrane protein n=1 Tax=Actinotalea sp. TaxID=1872145 RepID=UPI002BD7A6ED|nr:GlsB/YeaQ/YmgE family stress response membrane protein [Actinotalea sp.]HQY34584.1 GlsB/YeaQ/YmgE family stress response membrane protein [Actinotalea sp.]HRA51315.1 GlsB/YeaQ/YmgE family stress response membrane protein [Actinotalea sp.]